MSEMTGLDIGSHSIKLIGLKMTSKGPFLTHVGMKEIPPGRDKENINTFSETLKTLLEEMGLKKKKVNMAVSGSGVHIMRISIPSLPRVELKEAVRWEIKGHLPFPVETARVDFHILDEYVEDNVKKLDLIIVACPKSLIERTLSIAEKAGLQPTHLDVSPFALWNTLLALDRIKKEETVVLIDLGAEKTGIYLFKDRTLQFSREVTPAGADITRAIMEGIGSAGGPELNDERAESIKREIGIPLEPCQERVNDQSPSPSKIGFLIRPVLERLAAEIGRSLDYYKSQFNEARIDRLLLTGGGANLKNIVSYLGKELRLPVEQFNPLRKILFDPKKTDTHFIDQMGSTFTIAAGLALPEPGRIELLPAKEPFISKIKIGKSIPILAPLITVFIFSGIIRQMNGQVNSLQKEWNAKMSKVASLETLQAKLKLLKEKDLQIKEKLSQFPSSMTISVPYRDILREFNNILPDNVTLTLLSVRSKGKTSQGETPIGAEKELHLSGLAFGSDVRCLTALAQIIERLERSPLFKNVKLVSAGENKLYTQPGAGFEIVCDINAGEVSRP